VRNARLRWCLLALLALISPRLVLFVIWIFSSVLSRAFDSWIERPGIIGRLSALDRRLGSFPEDSLDLELSI